MLRFPSLGSNPPSERLWRWIQSLTRTAAPDRSGLIRIEPRKVYILPTRFGFLYGVMLLAMLLGSNNYGSNPGFLLTFLLAGLGMAALFQTWKNLVGIEITASQAEPVFCASEATFPLRLHNSFNTIRAGISASIQKFGIDTGAAIDLDPGSHAILEVKRTASERGLMPLGRVAIETRFPLGLFRAWAYIEPRATCLVYPKPAKTAGGISTFSHETTVSNIAETGTDDFAGHKPYQTGDSVMHVDWKALARGKGWWLKNFDAAKGDQVWLRWQAIEQQDVEQKLSLLSRAVLDLDLLDLRYGLELPGRSIAPGTGGSHRHRCLKALALFGKT